MKGTEIIMLMTMCYALKTEVLVRSTWASVAGVPSSYSTAPSISIFGIAMAPPGKYGL